MFHRRKHRKYAGPKMKMSGLLTVNSRTMVADSGTADMEVFKEIEKVYFSSSDEIDPNRYVLERAPSDCNAIEEMFIRLKRQQQVVSNKALHLISQKRDHCDREFKVITLIQTQLEDTIKTCRHGRQKLNSAKTNLTTSTFGILANFRKRQIVQGLLRSLNVINHLQQTEDEVQVLMRGKEYDAAIHLVLKGQRAAADLRHFKCVSSLTQRLQDTLNLAEEQLDGVLASVCYKFDSETYTKLQMAYSLLDKTQIAMDQLHMHFASAINISSLEALKQHQKETDQDHMNLKDLCSNVKETNVIVCMLDLCDRLWAVMLSYHCVVDWHTKQDETEDAQLTAMSEFEANVNKEYVRQKLKNGLMRIWHDVHSKVSTFLVQSGLPQYPFEKFVQVLGILKRLTEVAEEFCGDTSESLQTFIKDQSLTYLRNYYAGRMEVLRIFLENESWEICPVKSSFNVLQLQEFEKVKRHIKACSDGGNVKPKSRYSSMSTRTLSSDASSSVHSQDDSNYVGKYFTGNHRHTPFHIFRSESAIHDDIPDLDLDESDTQTDPSDEEELEELTRDFIDENPAVANAQSTNKQTVKKRLDPVIVTNTTLSVLRDCGQYLQMCRFLRPISFQVIMLMSQMFDYYLYSVHFFFASDLKVSSTTLYSNKLNSMLKRIGNNLITSDAPDTATEVVEDLGRSQKNIRPTSSQTIVLHNPENLHGLSERIVAVESLLFLAKQFEILQPYLESIVSPHQRIILQTFYEQTVAAAVDLRIPILMCVASQVFDVRKVLVSMSQVNWVVKNVMTQQSPYVDHILRDLQVFSMRLDQVSHTVTVSAEVHDALWSTVAKFIIHTLVEGFSNVSKCSDSGRGLMQLDYTQLLSKLSKVSGLKPVPYQEYVVTYVKAYYLTKPDLEIFIKEHSEYSTKHLTALVNCACDSKRSREELIAAIEEKENQSPIKHSVKNHP